MIHQVSVRRLTTLIELQAAITLFADSLSQSAEWGGVTSNAVRSWVQDEFLHLDALVLGAFDQEEILIGTHCVIPFDVVFTKLATTVQPIIKAATYSRSGESDMGRLLHHGGVSVRRQNRGQFIVSMLGDEALKQQAIQFGARATIVQTRSPKIIHASHTRGFVEIAQIEGTTWLLLPTPA